MTLHGSEWYEQQYDIACNRLVVFEKKKLNKIVGANGDNTKLAKIERRHKRLISSVWYYAYFCNLDEPEEITSEA